MRFVVLNKNLLERLRFVTPVEPAPIEGRFLILKATQQIHHKLLTIVLHYWMEFSRNQVFHLLQVLHSFLGLENGRIKKEKGVAIAKVVSQSFAALELGILLLQKMLFELLDRD
jgi:hypothetical protein